ncbi:peptidoglycan synthase FtsZ [Sphingomonas changbaiensis NBRC 104936]|uniref:Peptidoglycan synthase FtsZ n=1 Tax=Sphingomonas changbaiensis NBRC 104936 TaxID=1219043 RepID=A0A0E9MQS7_9SPHN|nr:penicillin-binding protein 2 [Sphingomonas changbaiensis]GAO39470.1 peptidoglycan synthase FtsZ [Sphingomonas changbaiensis NBRC 104936]
MATAAPSPMQLRALPERRPEIALAHVRLMLLMLLFIGATAMISLRIAYLSVFTDSSTNRAHVSGLARGDILDRNGIPLAQTIEAWSIGIHPGKVIGDKRTLAASLARLMPERSADEYLKILQSKLTFTYLRRRATPELVAAVNRLGEPGIDLGREPERIYPQGMLAAHVLGFTNFNGDGVSGMEKVLEKELTGSARGTGVMLSIDSRVQQALEAELGAAMTKFSANGAAGVVMDIKTGEVIALTSMPELNPNKPAQQGPDAAFNRATLGVYELGSTFKPFTVAMAMEDGVVKSFGQTYDCPRALHVGRFSITDTHPFGGACTVAEIMQRSSNIGTAQIAAQVGATRQREWLRRMHFLEKVSIELPERGRPLTPGDNWGEIATMTVGYGHGIAVSPLHLATGYATLFNGGYWRPATLLKHDAGRPVPKGERVFSAETSYKMRALLRLVVTSGTGRKADAPGYRIGGKTGTAEKIVGGRYTSGAVVTTFAGVFPMDEPRYVVVAMLDDPKGTKETFGFHTAGWNVAPVVSGVVSRIGPMLGVMPDEGREANMGEVLPFVHGKEE